MVTKCITNSSLYSMGCAIFDLILLELNQDDLKYIALLDALPDKNDIILESSTEIAGTILESHKSRLQLGGCSLSTLRLFSHLSLIQEINIESASCFIFSTGDDEFSQFFSSMLKATKVRQLPLINKGKSSSYCISKINKNKDKSFYNNNQTTKMITLNHIKNILESEFTDCQDYKFFLLDSYLINDCFDSYLFVCEYLKRFNKVKVVYNIADVYFYSQYTDKINKIIKEFADVVVCNECELEIMMQKNSDYQSVSPEAFLSLAEKLAYPKSSEKYGRSKIFISTRSDKPTWLALNELKDGLFTNQLIECEVAKLDEDKIVDFLGAGDSFTSGFLFGYQKMLTQKTCLMISDYKKCLRLGNQVASKTICLKGFNISEEFTSDYIEYINQLQDL